jgi:hypothetical protein
LQGREKREKKLAKTASCPSFLCLGDGSITLDFTRSGKNVPPLYLSPDLQLEFDGNFQMGK